MRNKHKNNGWVQPKTVMHICGAVPSPPVLLLHPHHPGPTQETPLQMCPGMCECLHLSHCKPQSLAPSCPTGSLDYIVRKTSSLNGWSGTEKAAQGSSGISIPRSVEKVCEWDTWEHGLVLG